MDKINFLIPILSHPHAVDSHSFTFPFPSLGLIPIPMGFPQGYSHSPPNANNESK